MCHVVADLFNQFLGTLLSELEQVVAVLSPKCTTMCVSLPIQLENKQTEMLRMEGLNLEHKILHSLLYSWKTLLQACQTS